MNNFHSSWSSSPLNMQIGSTLSPQNLNLFQARRTSFKRKVSALNPVRNPPSSTSQSLKPVSSIDLTRQHLDNLEKLLQKRSPPSQPHPEPVQKDPNVEGALASNGRRLLEGLKLTGIWPQVLEGDEMSPRHLSHLQRLLSKTAEYSPRNSLSAKWREYHGCSDWTGLLDPLDENLRREVIRYGEFVQAAYQIFHSNPAMAANEVTELSDKSYKVTKSLFATSSIGLPSWVDEVAPDLGWMTQRSSWIGYVAVCDDDREIGRMGRRDIVIALRGTATCLEWAENVRAQLISLTAQTDPAHEEPKVECGFLSLYKTAGVHVESLAESAAKEIRRLIEVYKGETLSITVTGHSLGAALALLVADEISTCAPEIPPIAVFSFGGPRVGNRSFSHRIESKNVKVLRVVNSQDVITRVPGPVISGGFGIGNDETITTTNNKAVIAFQMFVKNTLLAYSHVGTELRVDSKMSPYFKPNADAACCHDLEAYLHLVDGFIASNCPFRANAKRSLSRLLQHQKANMKKLYTSKGKVLSLTIHEREEAPLSGGLCLPSPRQHKP